MGKGQPWVPPIPGLTEIDYLDSTSLMNIEKLPKSMIVLGGSAVGLELAQAISRLGSKVLVVELRYNRKLWMRSQRERIL
jgi:mercuric reductase